MRHIRQKFNENFEAQYTANNIPNDDDGDNNNIDNNKNKPPNDDNDGNVDCFTWMEQQADGIIITGH